MARHGREHHVGRVDAVHVVGREGGALRALVDLGGALVQQREGLQAGLNLRG